MNLRGARPARTYSHLASAKRMPSEYEIVTSQLHYYIGRGFEVQTPVEAWYREHQTGSALTSDAWEEFRDPRETTYTRYVTLQRDRETYVDGVLRSMEERDYDKQLDPAWIDVLARVLAPQRFLFHGFAMLAAYVGQMAPSGRITITAAFQNADEVRRVQRIAYRTALLQLERPDLGAQAKTTWQSDPEWQPMRKLVERLLVTYDWGEAFTALSLCVKPVIDEILMVDLAEIARKRHDSAFGAITFSLDEDCRWHREWSQALVQRAISSRVENATVMSAWVARWMPEVEAAVGGLASMLQTNDGGALDPTRALQRAHQWRRQMGLSG